MTMCVYVCVCVCVCLCVCVCVVERSVPGGRRMDGTGGRATDWVLVEVWLRKRYLWHPHVEQTLHRLSAHHWRTGIHVFVACMTLRQIIGTANKPHRVALLTNPIEWHCYGGCLDFCPN